MFSLQTIVLVIFLLIIILFFAHNASKKEGLETMDATASAPTLVPVGEAGGAAAYAAAVKLNMTKMQDTLLVKKYKKDYESVILNMDDLVNNMMLKYTLNMKTDKNTMDENDIVKQLQVLNVLQNSKVALNSVMKFIDSQ